VAAAAPARVASFKLRLFEDHVRVALASGEPGVDLRGDEARAAFAAARPLFQWLGAREPGARFRSLSMDLATGRVLVTIDDGAARPRVVRIDAPASAELVLAAADVLAFLDARAGEKLARRRSGGG
jgi:hypothetical protein